ncbi:hypothetical protein [Streptomyces sp. R35]|uniref:Major facilitator superfamily (MFS) profile domain-containing protein n=1 Tax=Streptomyces sp. R35 TaxID=3238630 RepID=A0AB39SPT3_9ACTN
MTGSVPQPASEPAFDDQSPVCLAPPIEVMVNAVRSSTENPPRHGETAVPARRPGVGSLVLLASIVISLLAASSAPNPLYARYAAAWRFSPITTTVVFGAYAIAVLLSLLIFGRVSDHIGRRPVVLAALG